MSGGCEPGKVHDYVRKLLAETELGVVLRNRIYKLDQEAKKYPRLQSKKVRPQHKPIRECLDVVDMARMQWDTRLKVELTTLISKLNRKSARKRERKKDSSSGADDAPNFPVRFVYTSEDLLEVITSVSNPNFSGSYTRIIGWQLTKLHLKTPTVTELRQRYRELSPQIRQMGVDNNIYGSEWFGAERERTGAALATNGYIPHLKNFAKTGVPQSQRPALWARILGCVPGPKEFHYYQTVKDRVNRVDLVSDYLVRFDVQETSDYDEFFVFSDPLLEIMLIFSRDTQIPKLCSLLPTTAVIETPNPLSEDEKISIPPSTVIPYYQMSLLAAPFSFVYAGVEEMYFVWRAMYCRYFCRLHVLSSRPDSILYLSRMFENLLLAAHPKVFYHGIKVGAHPLRTAFPWIFTAFSGVLPVFQVLQLWDRVIAYDSLELIPTLAAAIYVFRAEHVLASKTAEEVHAVFKETVHIQAIPLLQHFLFARKAPS